MPDTQITINENENENPESGESQQAETEKQKPSANQVRDVDAVWRKNQELLDEVKRLKPLRSFEGMNVEEIHEALNFKKSVEEKKLVDKGKFDELLKKRENEFNSQLEKERLEKQSFLTTLKNEKLENYLVESGLMPERLKALRELNGLFDKIELATENGLQLKLRDGIGDAKELTTIVDGLKEKFPFLFSAIKASGSGATASNSSNGSDLNKNVEPGLARITQALNTALPQ